MIHDGKPLLRGCHSGPGPVRVRVRSGPAVRFRSVRFMVGPVPVGPVPVGPVLASRFPIMDHGSWIMDQGSWIKDQGSWIKDQRSRTKDQGSRIKDPGSRTKDQGPRIKDYGLCFGTNEHPRRDTGVILRQSKALIEIFKSR